MNCVAELMGNHVDSEDVQQQSQEIIAGFSSVYGKAVEADESAPQRVPTPPSEGETDVAGLSALSRYPELQKLQQEWLGEVDMLVCRVESRGGQPLLRFVKVEFLDADSDADETDASPIPEFILREVDSGTHRG
jgi:hypothetical protein